GRGRRPRLLKKMTPATQGGWAGRHGRAPRMTSEPRGSLTRAARKASCRSRKMARRSAMLPRPRSGPPATTTRVGSPPVCESITWMRSTLAIAFSARGNEPQRHRAHRGKKHREKDRKRNEDQRMGDEQGRDHPLIPAPRLSLSVLPSSFCLSVFSVSSVPLWLAFWSRLDRPADECQDLLALAAHQRQARGPHQFGTVAALRGGQLDV